MKSFKRLTVQLGESMLSAFVGMTIGIIELQQQQNVSGLQIQESLGESISG